MQPAFVKNGPELSEIWRGETRCDTDAPAIES